MSAKLSPEWRLNQGFDTQKESPFHLNRGVPSKEVIDTKVMGWGSGTKVCVPSMEVSQRRGSSNCTYCCAWTTTNITNILKYWLLIIFLHLKHLHVCFVVPMLLSVVYIGSIRTFVTPGYTKNKT